MCIYLPINAEDHQQEGGEDVAPSPDHHEQLAHHVPPVPLDGEPPDRLHGQRHVGGDGVRQGQVEYQVVHVGATPHLLIILNLTHFYEFFATSNILIIGKDYKI